MYTIIGVGFGLLAAISAIKENHTGLLLFTVVSCYYFLLQELENIKDKLKWLILHDSVAVQHNLPNAGKSTVADTTLWKWVSWLDSNTGCQY